MIKNCSKPHVVKHNLEVDVFCPYISGFEVITNHVDCSLINLPSHALILLVDVNFFQSKVEEE